MAAEERKGGTTWGGFFLGISAPKKNCRARQNWGVWGAEPPKKNMYRYTKITRFHRRTHPERRVYHAHGLQILISLKPACSRSSNHIAARRIIPPLREGWYLCPPLQTRVVHRGSSPEGGLVLFAEGWRMPPWYSNLGALVSPGGIPANRPPYLNTFVL